MYINSVLISFPQSLVDNVWQTKKQSSKLSSFVHTAKKQKRADLYIEQLHY